VSEDEAGGTGAERAVRAAEEAAEQATAARDEAAELRDEAARHRAEAADHSGEAADARVDAARERERAAAHEDGAEDARDDAARQRERAAAHEDGAEDARDDAARQRERAAAHEDEAEDARDGAEEARRGAEVARVDAVGARDVAVRASAEAVEVARGLSDLPDGDPVLDADVRAEEAGVDAENPLGRPGPPLNRRSPFRVGFGAAIGVGAAYLLYQAVLSARGVLVLVTVAAFLAIGLNPIVTRLERTGMRRGAAVGIVFLGLLGFFALFGYAVLPPVITQATNFVTSLPTYVDDLSRNPTVMDLDKRFGLIDRLNDAAGSIQPSQIAANALTVTQRVAGLILKGLTVLILTLYFLSSFNTIKNTFYRLVPRSRRARVSLIGDEILTRVGGYVAGAVVVALIAGVATLVWVEALGIPYPLALALIVTFTDVIPLIGATIGAVIVTAVAFFVSLPVGIATGIFFLVYQQVENYLVYPRVMSRSVDVNPAAAIVGALIGGTLLGFVGALLAVPATAAIQLILREVLVPRQDAQ
jgi:predicted PurR-regulated permease PerM